MSASAAGMVLGRAATFYQIPIGKKVLTAVTGAMLFAYVLAHLFGNLQIYAGREQINRYAEFLHSMPGPLWVARLVLLAAVSLHMLTVLQLWLLKRKARPIGYVKGSSVPPGYASRTMLWTGPLIAALRRLPRAPSDARIPRPSLPRAGRLRQRRERFSHPGRRHLLHRLHAGSLPAPLSRPLEHVPVRGRQPPPLHADP